MVESQDQRLVVSVLYVPCLLDSEGFGEGSALQSRALTAYPPSGLRSIRTQKPKLLTLKPAPGGAGVARRQRVLSEPRDGRPPALAHPPRVHTLSQSYIYIHIHEYIYIYIYIYIWPGDNVCFLNLETGALQLWLTPRGYYTASLNVFPQVIFSRILLRNPQGRKASFSCSG